jgi:hypothetical protein
VTALFGQMLRPITSQSTSQSRLYGIAYTPKVMDDPPEITVLRLPKFTAEATELIGADGIETLAFYLIDRPSAKS